MKPTFDKTRPLSWSAISSFEYDPEQWYAKYCLNKPQPASPAMAFGKKVAEAIENGKPPAPLTVLSQVEHKLEAKFGKIPLIGFIDTYEPGKRLGEFKTGKKAWTQKRADDHGQIDMYLLIIWLRDKIPPEQIECYLEWMPTQENGDFSISMIDSSKVHHFPTRRTMRQVLNFGMRINKVYKQMEEYAKNHA